MDHTASDWLVQPIIASGRLHSITSAPKIGKSLVALHVAACAATGRRVLGIMPERKLRVLYLDQEMGPADLQERLVDMGFSAEDDFSELHYFQLTPLLPLDTAPGAAQLVQLVRSVQPDLVVIDTLARVVEGDENDAATYHDLYRLAFQPIRAMGVAVLRLDHAGHENARARGSSAKASDVDVAWFLERLEFGLRLKATHRRLGWVPEVVDLTQLDDPLCFDLLSGTGWPAGTAETAALLDDLGVALDASGNAAQKALKDAGEGRKRTLVLAAQRWRTDPSRGAFDPGNHPGNHPPAGTPRNHPRNHLEEPSNTKAEPPPEPPGTTPPGQVVPGFPPPRGEPVPAHPAGGSDDPIDLDTFEF